MPACAPARAAPSSLGGAGRAARASRPEERSIRPLTRRADFDLLFGTGTRVRRGGLTLVRAPAPDGMTAVAVIAGRRVGSAVKRNRAKRRLRAALARTSPPTGELVAVMATKGVLDADFEDIVEWLRQGFAAEVAHAG